MIKNSLTFLSITLLISFSTSAFCSFSKGVNLYLDKSDEDYGLITSLVNPRLEDPLQYSSFQFASRLLLLGDGFSKKWTQNAEYLQAILPTDIDIYKTDIETPKDLDGVNTKNLYYKRIDHNERLPFENGFFDIVAMSYGLCICKPSAITCSGIDFSFKESNDGPALFLTEVARLLNSKNIKSVAFLHGPSNTNNYPELQPYEEKKYRVLSELIPKLEKQFPQLNLKLVFMKIKKEFSFQGIYIRVRHSPL